MTRQRRRLVIRFVEALAVGQFLLAAVLLGRSGAPGALGGDFIAYYSAGKQVLAGDALNLYNLAAQMPYQDNLLQRSGLSASRPTMIPFDYPPPAALLFLPFALLRARLAVFAWLAVNLVAAFVSWRLLVVLQYRKKPPEQIFAGVPIRTANGARSPEDAPLTRGWHAGPLAVFILFPMDWGLLSGQPVGLLLLFAVLSFQCLLAEQDRRAGAMLGLIGVFKPQLIIVPLVGLLALRRPRAILGAAMAGGALLALSIILVGVPGLVAYIGLLRQIDPALGNTAFSVRTGAMVNWRALMSALPGVDGATVLFLTAVAAVLTTVLALIPCLWRRGDRSLAPLYLGVTAAGLVSGYHSHYQDLVILLPPAIATLPYLGIGHVGIWSRTTPRAAMASFIAGRHSVRKSFAGVAALGAVLALVVCPGLAWLLFGIFALAWLPVWTFLAVPGLLLVMVAVWLGSSAIPGPSDEGGTVNLAAATLSETTAPASTLTVGSTFSERELGP